MADKGTEQATPLRKKKAREKGDSVHSRELLSATAMLGGVVGLGTVAERFRSAWSDAYVKSIHAAMAAVNMPVVGSQDQTSQLVLRLLAPALLPVGFVMAASFAGALLSGVAQSGGVQIRPNALTLKFSRLNPLANFGNMFSLRSATRVVKSLVPAAVMILLGWTALSKLMIRMPVMSLLRLPETFTAAYGLALDAAWITLAWSGLDYAIEWRSWNQRLKMSKQEVREEMRDAMGNPQIKAKLRQIQRAMRKRRIKADMSRATVVITNPTHYAVALEFSFETMSAPIVLAKGRDLLAAEIREEARWAGIPLIENPPLARSLYKMVEPGQSIPFELYAAVAGILAYLYRQKVDEKMQKKRDTKQQFQQAESLSWTRDLGAMSKDEVRQVGGGM